MPPPDARRNQPREAIRPGLTLEEVVEERRRDASAPRPEESFVGRHRLCFELASGGMASVYLARVDGPANFQKLVALKRIHPHLAKVTEFIEMFLDEAAIAARIDHPNVCSVMDFGREGESHFLTMEYLVGEPLSRIILAAQEQEPDDWALHAAMIARIVADACEGLHAAHELRNARGEPLHVVHRDISPDNIIVTYDGVPKIVDFGVASARDRIHKTTTGLVKGKNSYMAPELLEGEAIDRRVDIWGMGVVLWEGLCLRRLFRRKSEAETLYAVVAGDIPSPSSVRPELPGQLDAVVTRALTRDVESRVPNARQLADELRRYLNGLDEPVGPPEVAAWLDGLFPGVRQRKRELMELALSLPDSVPPSPSVDDAAPDATSVLPAPAIIQRRGRRRLWPWLAALGSFALLSFGAIAWAGLAAPDTPPRSTQASNDRPGSSGAPAATGSPQAASAPGETEDGTAATGASGAPPSESPEPSGLPAERAEAPAEPEPRARPLRHGTAVVLVPPDVHWAHVYHRGRRLPHTAPGSFRLPAGRQVLEVRFMGEPPGQRVVANVRGGSSVTVRAER